nr:hypothetical protein CFP56_36207 [Quercus suber]
MLQTGMSAARPLASGLSELGSSLSDPRTVSPRSKFSKYYLTTGNGLGVTVLRNVSVDGDLLSSARKLNHAEGTTAAVSLPLSLCTTPKRRCFYQASVLVLAVVSKWPFLSLVVCSFIASVKWCSSAGHGPRSACHRSTKRRPTSLSIAPNALKILHAGLSRRPLQYISQELLPCALHPRLPPLPLLPKVQLLVFIHGRILKLAVPTLHEPTPQGLTPLRPAVRAGRRLRVLRLQFPREDLAVGRARVRDGIGRIRVLERVEFGLRPREAGLENVGKGGDGGVIGGGGGGEAGFASDFSFARGFEALDQAIVE